MCTNQSSRVLHALKEWGKNNALSLIGIIIAVVSLAVAKSSQDIANSSLNIATLNNVPNVQVTGQMRFTATPDPNTYTLEVNLKNFVAKHAT